MSPAIYSHEENNIHSRLKPRLGEIWTGLRITWFHNTYYVGPHITAKISHVVFPGANNANYWKISLSSRSRIFLKSTLECEMIDNYKGIVTSWEWLLCMP